jgi:hypothetical protein
MLINYTMAGKPCQLFHAKQPQKTSKTTELNRQYNQTPPKKELAGFIRRAFYKRPFVVL